MGSAAIPEWILHLVEGISPQPGPVALPLSYISVADPPTLPPSARRRRDEEGSGASHSLLPVIANCVLSAGWMVGWMDGWMDGAVRCDMK